MSGADRSALNAEIIRSKRKTLAMQISDEGKLIVRVPLRCPNKEIVSFIEKNEKWITAHIEKANKQNEERIAAVQEYLYGNNAEFNII